MPAAGGERRTDGGMVGIYNSRLASLINASYIYLVREPPFRPVG